MAIDANACVYGPLVSGSGYISYNITGTALGTWSVDGSCGLTLPPAPPPSPPPPPWSYPPYVSAPPSPPPPPASASDLSAMLAVNASWCAPVPVGGVLLPTS